MTNAAHFLTRHRATNESFAEERSPACSRRSSPCARRTISASAMSRRCGNSSIGRRAIGFKLVQLLPINETGGDNSPYNAISSVRDRTDHAASRARLAGGSDAGRLAMRFSRGRSRTLRRGRVKYAASVNVKTRLLEMAFAHFRRAQGERSGQLAVFDDFCRDAGALAGRLRFVPRADGTKRRARNVGLMAGGTAFAAAARTWLER